MLDAGMEHNCVFTKKINKINTLSNTSALGLCMGSFVKQILTKSQNSLDHLEGRSRKGGSDLKSFLNSFNEKSVEKNIIKYLG